MEKQNTEPLRRSNAPVIIILVVLIAAGLVYKLLSRTDVPSDLRQEAEQAKLAVGPELADTVDMRLSDGSVYEGSIIARSRTPHGYGVMVRPDGVTYEGDWQYGALPYGKRTSDTAVYTGKFDDQLRYHGFGIIDYSRQFVESQVGGGVAESEVIRRYAGNWNHDSMQGIGRAYMADGSQQFGKYLEGKFQKAEGAQYAVSDRVYGIDLSHHNREIDWDNLALYCDAKGSVYHQTPAKRKYMQPVSFVYMKATEGGNHVDTTYAVRAREADIHGIAKGAYHFLRLASPIEDQVRNFIETVNWQPGDMPPALDVEMPGELRRHGVDGVFEWLEAVEKELGVRPIIYTGDNIRTKYLSKDPRFNNYECWIARYNPAGPQSGDWQIWQMSDKGKGLGHSGQIDINIFGGNHDDFNNYRRDVALGR